MAGQDRYRRYAAGAREHYRHRTGWRESPYGGYSRQGAVIVPRCLFFVNETDNAAVVQAAPTVTVNPRRGSQDHAPWRDLDLTSITGQTVESRHLFNVHLGETIAPYIALKPLKALLPLKQGDATIPAEADGPGGIRLGGLERRMRDRWQTVSAFWEGNKAPANQLHLLGQLDYLHKLSSQLEWQRDPEIRPVRIAYAGSGMPTAALVSDEEVLIDYTLFWVACKDMEEANYLLAIINSEALYEGVQPLMPKGQFGARHVQKHLWQLPIPEFDPSQELHATIAEAGATAAAAAENKLAELREDRGDPADRNHSPPRASEMAPDLHRREERRGRRYQAAGWRARVTPRPAPHYEWDESKREDTLRIRGIDFLIVEQADWTAAIHRRSDRDGEFRYSSYVPIGDRLYNVVWTPRGSHTRIISLRKANGREITRYEQEKA